MTPTRRYFEGPTPRAIAHRGLAPRGDENTLAAFERALAAGAHVIETDTRATRDGVALTFHDATLERVANDPRSVAELSARELSSVRVAGLESVTRLDEALDAFPRAVFNIDVKDAGAVEPTARAIASTNAASRVCLTSFTPAVARAAARRTAELSGPIPLRSASRDTVIAFRSAVAAGAPDRLISRILKPVSALQIPRAAGRLPLVTKRTIAAAHRAGCEVHVWTIDHVHEMQSLLEMGVDGIVTNRVDALVELLAHSPLSSGMRDAK